MLDNFKKQIMKKPFHITWLIDENKSLTSGMDIEAPTMMDALAIFKIKVNKEPLNVVDKTKYNEHAK